MGINRAQFQKAYPNIKLNTFAAARGPELLQRLMAERRAGKHLADVYMTGIGTHIALYTAKAYAPVRPALYCRMSKTSRNGLTVNTTFYIPRRDMRLCLRGA